jgi:hypothetical protein
MKMNAAPWIGLAAGILIFVVSMIVGPGSNAPGTYIAVGVVSFLAGMGFFFYKILVGPMINARRLSKHGLPGKAKILDVRDTGVTINNNPLVKLTLEVKNSLGQKYTTTCRTLVSRINPSLFQPGMEVPVRIDPKNEQNVIIDRTDDAQNSPAPVASISQPDELKLKAELEQMQKDNEALTQSGRPARAIIKKYTWLGAYVNGSNPYVELEVEVLPDNSGSFSSKTRGVISEGSVNKYQPGSEIFVRYDLYDNGRCVIEHSK